VLAERLVREVAQYYSVYGRPAHWVFPQRADATRHLDASSAQKIYTTAKRRAGIEKAGGIRDPQPGSRCRSTHLGTHARAHQRDDHHALAAHHHQAPLRTDLAAGPSAACATPGRATAAVARCRELLSTTPVPSAATPLPAEAATAAATPEDTTLETTPRCPQCGASLRIIELLPPQPPDTS
jgi:hypothetical protein